MNTILRIVFAVITLLCTLSVFGLAIWSIFMGFWGNVLVCSMITVMFGILLVHDYKFFFGKKAPTPTQSNNDSK